MKRSILAKSTKSCTGCSACAVVCPKNAISVALNGEGFFSAVVDENKCVNCGICQTVCSRFLSSDTHTLSMEKCRVAGANSSTPHIQCTTTSGGIAYELSKWGIENGYRIFGIMYNYASDKAVGILVDSIEGLEILKGSKYLQADISDALSTLYDGAKRFPDSKYVCFGTPCQIFGIRQLIERKKISNDFLLVDLFCHGVPSYYVWKPYVAIQHQKLGAFRKVEFRYKGNGWHQYTIRIEGEKGFYQEFAYKDRFYRFFFDNIALNRSCFTCDVRKNRVAADLRLGDFLGKKYEHREDGVSAVLVVTKKGKEWIDLLTRQGRIMIDEYWAAEACLTAQSTRDYPNMHLRDNVIRRLGLKENLSNVQKWYFRKLPIKAQIRSVLKRTACALPLSVVIRLRKLIRNI